jgi:hypothetical protein
MVILFDATEAADYGRKHRKKNDRILPIGPTARYYAEKQGWEINTLASLWTKEEYENAIKNSEQRIKLLVQELNEYSTSVAKNYPLTIGDYFNFNLQIGIGIVHYNQFIIESILKIKDLKKIVFYNKKESEELINDFWPDYKTFLPKIIETVTKDEIELLFIKESPLIQKNKLSHREKIKEILPDKFTDIYRSTKLHIKDVRFKIFDRKKLLLLGGRYDWVPLINDQSFRKSYLATLFDPDYLIPNKSSKNKHFEAINNIFYDKAKSHVKNYDFSYQATVISRAIDYFDSGYLKNVGYLKTFKGILTTVHSNAKESYFCHLSNINNIPVINWQHGEMGLCFTPFCESTETKYTNHYFCYGKEVASKYESWIGKSYLKKVHIVGSTKKVITQQSDDIILYATGKWLTNGVPITRTLDPQLLDIDSRLYRGQATILKYLDQLGGKNKIVLKANPGPNDLPYELNNVEVEYKGYFTNLLKSARCVILDVPATTLIEAVSTKIPIFVLYGREPWFEKPLRLIKKRAVVEEDPAKLMKHLDRYIKYGDYPADLNNNEFLEGWGSCFSVDQTKKNVMRTLKEIINQ